jgi:heavy metal translocating P-type ATPase
MRLLHAHGRTAFFVLTTVLLPSGLAASRWSGRGGADLLWVVSTLIGLVVCTGWLVGSLRRRELGVDVIALLALAGTLAVGEPLAGAVVAWMLAAGSLLEERAQARARRELSLLVERAPRTARRRTGALSVGQSVEQVPVEALARGDEVLVGPGEVVPVDGRLLEPAVLEESALTGEALPVEREIGQDARSGTVNAGGPFVMVATSTSGDSTYARIVQLVRSAQASSAPFVRAADRVAIAFVPFTLVLAGLAWVLARDPVRAVAVLVVATPCPLLLAAPIAVMSGLSRAASIGVVVKGGGALERLARGKVLLFDKTGTLTRGRPTVVDVVAGPGFEPVDVLRLAAGLDQVSPHVLAAAIVAAGHRAGLVLDLPTQVTERHGYGVEGLVAGHLVRLGKAGWVAGDQPPDWTRAVRRRAGLDGSLTVFAAVDGVPAGALLLEDPVRSDAPRMVRALRRAGIERVVLITGDRADVAEAVGRIVGVDAVHADQDPSGKLALVVAAGHDGPTVMVGDGINDAPALAAAGVGVALAARGATASSEAADVVLTVDRVDRLAEAITIARRSRRIATQAVLLGMGLSVLAMVAAAAGLLPPTTGALLQEGIDVLAIAVALRAVLPSRHGAPRLTQADSAVLSRIQAQHSGIGPIVEQVRSVADGLVDRAADGVEPVRDLLRRLEAEVIPHERDEERLLYPVIARVVGGDDPTGAMSRAHAEIEHQTKRLHRMLDELGEQRPVAPHDVVDLQRLLYGLYAVLRLHRAQEEEGMFSLLDDAAPTRGGHRPSPVIKESEVIKESGVR